jgi:hypothetical protein
MLEKSQGNFQRARDLLVKGVRLVPRARANPHLYQSLGVMAAERGRPQAGAYTRSLSSTT